MAVQMDRWLDYVSHRDVISTSFDTENDQMTMMMFSPFNAMNQFATMCWRARLPAFATFIDAGKGMYICAS